MKNLLLALTIVSFCLSGIVGTPVRTGLCLPEKLCDGQTTSCKIGNFIRVVVEIKNNHTASRFYAFCLTVDQLTQINLVGSSGFLNSTYNSSVTLHIGDSGGPYILSEKRYYTNQALTAFVAYYTIKLKMTNGLFTVAINSTLPFENNCDSAGEWCILDNTQPCIRGVDCGIRFGSSSSIGNSNNEDVKIFIGFDGTDNGQNPLRSAGILPTQFRAYAFSNYFNQISSVFVPSIN